MRLPGLVAFAVGAALWFAASFASGKREPWDGAMYWAVAYPLAIVAAAILGYRSPQRAWRWALWLFAGQFVAMCIRNGELGNLWPLGLVFFAILALPAVAAAAVASRFAARGEPAA